MFSSLYNNSASNGSNQFFQIRGKFSAIWAASRLVKFPLCVSFVALAVVPFLVDSIEAHVCPRQYNPPPSYTAVFPKPVAALPT